MPDNDTWPPKPSLPDPLAEYDDVIAAKLAALSETKTGPNKIQLIKALRDEEGMHLSQAYALVTSYCDRRGLFPTSKTTMALGYGGCGLFVTVLSVVVFSGYLVEARRALVLRQPRHHAALMAVDRQEMAVMATIMALMVGVAIVAAILTAQPMSRRRK